MSSANHSVNRAPKWFRNIAGTIIVISGGYWSFHGLTSGLSVGLGFGGILFHTAVPGLIFLFSAAVAWCWKVIGGVMLVIEGLVAFFIYSAYLSEWGISPDSIFVMLRLVLTTALPPLVSGCLFILSWRKSRASKRDSGAGLNI
jgi:hypothetical protein